MSEKKEKELTWEEKLERDICPYRDTDMFGNDICELQEGDYCNNEAKDCDWVEDYS